MVSTTSTIVHESYSKYSEYSEYSKYRPSTHLQECCCSKKGGMPRSADWLSGEGGGESRVASQLEKISAGGGIHPTDESAAATPSGCMGGGVGGTAGVKLWGSASVQGCCPLRWFRSQSLLRLRSPASASWQARLSSRSSAHIDSSLCTAVDLGGSHPIRPEGRSNDFVCSGGSSCDLARVAFAPKSRSAIAGLSAIGTARDGSGGCHLQPVPKSYVKYLPSNSDWTAAGSNFDEGRLAVQISQGWFAVGSRLPCAAGGRRSRSYIPGTMHVVASPPQCLDALLGAASRTCFARSS
jgi:hypothetical protein